MSFLKKLFGGGSVPAEQAGPAAETEYNGYSIKATPFQDGGQWQTCGVIAREIAGVVKEHKFIRADRFASRDLAAEQALFKARQIIDQQGEKIFEQGGH